MGLDGKNLNGRKMKKNNTFKWNETIQEMQGLQKKEKPVELKKYKSFHQQMIGCKENGNLIRIDSSVLYSFYGVDIPNELICIKYKCICHSGACREERI